MLPTERSRSICLEGFVSSPPSIAHLRRLLHYQSRDSDVLQASGCSQTALSSTKDNRSILHCIPPLKRPVEGGVPSLIMLFNPTQTVHDCDERPGFPGTRVRLHEGKHTATFCYDGLKLDDPLHKDLVETSAFNPNVRHDLELGRLCVSYTDG